MDVDELKKDPVKKHERELGRMIEKINIKNVTRDYGLMDKLRRYRLTS